jgi:hypothetical protein
MAGKLVADTLESATGGRPSVTKGAFVQAWVKFAGATGVIDKSFNVSSVTRTATGDHTVNFTNAFADTGYVMAGQVALFNSTALASPYESLTTARTTSAIRVWTAGNAGTGGDSTIHTLMFVGTN